MDKDRINEFAILNGYDGAEFLKKWNGYDCYNPIIEGDEIFYTGLPLLILVKGDKIRMSTGNECMEARYGSS